MAAEVPRPDVAPAISLRAQVVVTTATGRVPPDQSFRGLSPCFPGYRVCALNDFTIA
jgi:hypothetical protein